MLQKANTEERDVAVNTWERFAIIVTFNIYYIILAPAITNENQVSPEYWYVNRFADRLQIGNQLVISLILVDNR